MIVSDKEFREYFEQFGKVVDSVVMYDRDTHRSRGFGFVTYEDIVSVCLCVLLCCQMNIYNLSKLH